MMSKLLPFSFFFFVLTSAFSQLSDTVQIKCPNGMLEGTLSIADTSIVTPVVYIIAGSGPNDRDGNQPGSVSNMHLMLSEELLAQGISTLRVDKRMSGNSIFEMKTEEDMSFDYFVEDAHKWIEFLDKQYDFSKIIILGHSQGSLVGMLAAQDNDKVDGFISLAGPSGYIHDKLREQIYAQTPFAQKQLDPIFDKLAAGERVDSIPVYFNSIVRPSVQPFMISWMKYKPAEEIQKLNIPVSIIQGTTDIQVGVDDAEELSEAKQDASLILIEGMNHAMKDAPMDRMKNIATYTDLSVPLNSSITQHIVEFTNSLK